MNDTELFSIMVDNLKDLVDSDTVIGREIITPNNTLVVPISKVSVGIVSGSAETGETLFKKPQTAGGGGAGGSVVPLGFLVMSQNNTKYINIEGNSESKWTNLINSAIELIKSDK